MVCVSPAPVSSQVRQPFIFRTLVAAIVLIATPAAAFAASGELVIVDWLSGSDGDMMHAMEAAFQKSHPLIRIREINLTVQGDARGAIRTALLGGEKADLLINTWPAFRAELADAGLLRPLDAAWNTGHWSDNLGAEWKRLGQY
jgi:ABC-type glycerol-3-phosphate transport system substrate-binding protein